MIVVHNCKEVIDEDTLRHVWQTQVGHLAATWRVAWRSCVYVRVRVHVRGEGAHNAATGEPPARGRRGRRDVRVR